MRVVIDTNLWISALYSHHSLAAELFGKSIRTHYQLLYSEQQMDEFRRVSRYFKLKGRIRPADAGALVNLIRKIGNAVVALPNVDHSPDPFDNYLLGMAGAGQADFLISGDKTDLLALRTHGSTRIVTVRQFLDTLNA